MDEIDLDLVGVFQRFVAFAQRALDIDGIGDVVKRHQRSAVRQRYGGAVDDAAVAPLKPPGNGFAAVDRGDDLAQRLPRRIVAVQRLAAIEMASICGRSASVCGGSFHIRRKRGIEQPQAAVAAEYGDAFGEIVERLALDADQLLKAPLQVEPFGYVVEQVSHAAVRIGRGDHAQGAPIRQMPGVLVRFHRAIGAMQLRLPLPEILLLGQLARRPQQFKHGRIARAAGRDARHRNSTVPGKRHCKMSAADGIEHGDAGRQLVKRAPVRVDHAAERAAHGFGFGGVDAKAGAPAGASDFEHIETAPCAGDHGGQSAGKSAGGCALMRDNVARLVVEKFESSFPTASSASRRFDRLRVGGIDEGEPPGRVPNPDRRRQPLDQSAQR